jgi:hypothetical protein
VNSNVFYNAGSPGTYHFGAIHINGGGNNSFNNNYFINCNQAFSNSQWSQQAWHTYVTDPAITNNWFNVVDVRSATFKSAYPKLAAYVDSTTLVQRQNTITNSLTYNVKTFAVGPSLVISNTYNATSDPGFQDLSNRNFTLTQSPAPLAQSGNWKPIPFNEIGLRK